jgi:hypothetical protein
MNVILFNTIDSKLINYFYITVKNNFEINEHDTNNLFTNDDIIQIIVPKNYIVNAYYRSSNMNNNIVQHYFSYHNQYNYSKLGYIPKIKNDMIIYKFFITKK